MATFKLKEKTIPEKVIETHILRYLWWKKVKSWKVNNIGVWDQAKGIYRKAHSPYIIKGVADILGIYKGRMLAIEVKSATGVVRGEQKDFIDMINAEGGIAFIARDLKTVQEKLFPEEVKK